MYLNVVFRACRCWDVYRQGRCADKLSNYMGDHVNITKAKRSSFRYFMRTFKDGGNMGDTSNFNHYETDFVYDHDMTCQMDHSNIRKKLISKFSI